MKKTIIYLLLIAGVLSSAIYSCKKEEKCSDTITYTNTMKSIIDAKCISCHKVGGVSEANGVFTTYQGMSPHFDHAFEAVEAKEMPQAGAPQLTEDEIQQWKCWKEGGFKE